MLFMHKYVYIYIYGQHPQDPAVCFKAKSSQKNAETPMFLGLCEILRSKTLEANYV